MRRRVQALVYIFIALACASMAATAYLALAFTPIEAMLAALASGCLSILLMERQLRQRAEARLEKAVEDLSRLLSTDAQAGAVLGQRINALVDQNAGKRLESVEADISVLGTVVRQIAEAVADLEEKRRHQNVPQPSAPATAASPLLPVPEIPVEPAVPLTLLRQAIDEGRLAFHVEAIVTLPQRRPYGYDLVPRLLMKDGELAERNDFMPVRGGETVVRSIEASAFHEAITIARRSRTAGTQINLITPLTRATFADASALDSMLSALDSNRAIAGYLGFSLTDVLWRSMTPPEKEAVASLVRKGANLSLIDLDSLRLDFGALAGEGIRSVRVDAGRFMTAPQEFTDFHASDIGAYLARFGVSLIASNVRTEQQVLALLEDGIGLAQGPHLMPLAALQPELAIERSKREPTPRRVQV